MKGTIFLKVLSLTAINRLKVFSNSAINVFLIEL